MKIVKHQNQGIEKKKKTVSYHRADKTSGTSDKPRQNICYRVERYEVIHNRTRYFLKKLRLYIIYDLKYIYIFLNKDNLMFYSYIYIIYNAIS